MDNWTVIRVLMSNGFYRFDAFMSDPTNPLDPSIDIEDEDGEVIKAGDYSIVVTGYTESQVDDFFATTEQINANAG